MYSILKLSWDEVLDSEYVFQSNHSRMIIELSSKCTEDTVSDSSSILIFYNYYDKLPMLLIERIPIEVTEGKDLTNIKVDGYVVSVDEAEDGENIDIVCTKTDLYSTLLSGSF